MNKLLEFLGYGELPYPYTDDEFVSKLTSRYEQFYPEIVSDKKAQRTFLSELVLEEWRYLFPLDLFPPRSLVLWGSDGDPANVLFAFSELEAEGRLVTPAFQKILSIATEQYFADERPIGSSNKGVIRRNDVKDDAVCLMMALKILLGDKKDKAAQKVANYYKTLGPEFERGLGTKTLLTLYTEKREWLEYWRNFYDKMPDDVKEAEIVRLSKLTSDIAT